MDFTVVIPTYNRPASLLRCLESFTRLDYPAGQWELIVVNDGGSHSFEAIPADLQQTLPLRLLTIGRSGPAAARNAGARLATGTFLAFTDDDCQVAPDWLRCFTRGFAAGESVALAGRPVTPFTERTAGLAWQHLTDFMYSYMRDEQGNALLLMSNNVAYQRSVFEELKGFDQSFPLAAGEDMELSYRLVIHGYRQSYVPEAQVWHVHDLTPWGHLRQQFRYGRGAYYFRQAQNQLKTGKQPFKIHAQTTFYRALGHSVRQAGLPFSVSLLVAAAQLAYRFGAAYQTMRALL